VQTSAALRPFHSAALHCKGGETPRPAVATPHLRQEAFGIHEGLPFRKPVDKLTSVGEVVLDATHWKTSDHFYDSFFKAVGAPAWHGRNFDALNDSIVTGNINQIEVPYRIFIENLSQAGSEARAIAEGFIELIRQFEAEGCPIEIQIDQVT
jgi:RNAse (barnase) inhibitor barstar